MSQLKNKRYYDVSGFYRLVRSAASIIPTLIRAQRSALVDPQFREKIILAVTEVNGCAICSQVHTALALKSGMSEQEISEMLSGVHANIKDNEGVAIMFAQHYADTSGHPDNEVSARLASSYSQDEVRDIHAFIKLIMVTNAHGNAFNALKQRFRRKAVGSKSFSSDLMIALGFPLFIPVGLLHNLFSRAPLS